MPFKKIFKLIKGVFKGKKGKRKSLKPKTRRTRRRVSSSRRKPARRKSARRISSRRRKVRRPSKKRAVKSLKKKVKIRKILPGKGKKKKEELLASPIGLVTHYFPKVNAAVVKLKKGLKLGDPILIKGKTTDFRQMASSMQIDRRPIEKAKAGDEIGLEVLKEVRPGDVVYRVKG